MHSEQLFVKLIYIYTSMAVSGHSGQAESQFKLLLMKNILHSPVDTAVNTANYVIIGLFSGQLGRL